MTITTPKEDAMTKYKLQNGDRNLEFEGELLGEASTRTKRDADLHRWTEVRIFKTAAGAYVVQRCGRSRVWHDPDSPSASGVLVGWDALEELSEEQFEDLVPSTVNPPRKALHEYDEVRLETTRATCSISLQPEGVIEALRGRDGSGVLFLARVSKQALDAAAEKDEALKDAWKTERVA